MENRKLQKKFIAVNSMIQFIDVDRNNKDKLLLERNLLRIWNLEIFVIYPWFNLGY